MTRWDADEISPKTFSITVHPVREAMPSKGTPKAEVSCLESSGWQQKGKGKEEGFHWEVRKNWGREN